MTAPVSIKGVLLIKDEVVLLKNERDEWELPGGRIEAGETHEQTLAREFNEELALDVEVGPPIDSYVYEVIPGRQVQIVTYGCTLAASFWPRISDEHLAHCLWPVARLSELKLPAGYRRSVEKWAACAS